MTPLDLPDGKPPLAKEFSTAQLMARIVDRCIDTDDGGSLALAFYPAQMVEVRIEEGGGQREISAAYWLVSAEYGREASDSPMAGAAINGTGPTLRLALEQAGDDARLWRSDLKYVAEVEKEQHGG